MSHDENTFSAKELARYHRHIMLPQLGIEGQQKLKAAKVLVVGAGGLGSPVLLYLAAAGVGCIGIVEFDAVEDSNLHRQVLYGVEDVGMAKVAAAKRRLEALNPHIHIELHETPLNTSNALEIIATYDLVADGSDNFPTRYLVNDACVLLGKVNVYASVFQFEGQVSVFNYLDAEGLRGPNYRDIFPAPPPAGVSPSCAESGVLGVLPGIIGSMQANEVIKVVTGIGEPLNGRFFIFDALSFEARTFKITRREDNPLNGKNPSITALIDYEAFCGVKISETPLKTITAQDLRNWQLQREDFQLIDVREPEEYALANIGAELLPLATITQQIDHIRRDGKVVLHCQTGRRSAQAIRQLEAQFGFDNLYNLEGGLVAYWAVAE